MYFKVKFVPVSEVDRAVARALMYEAIRRHEVGEEVEPIPRVTVVPAREFVVVHVDGDDGYLDVIRRGLRDAVDLRKEG